MKASKLTAELNPLIGQGAVLIDALDRLADAGVGERTRDTLQAAAMAVESANRLMVLAFEECQGKDFCP